MGEYLELIRKAFLTETKSSAGDQARKMGLEYYGFGRYGRGGVASYKAERGRLVPFNPNQQQSPGGAMQLQAKGGPQPQQAPQQAPPQEDQTLEQVAQMEHQQWVAWASKISPEVSKETADRWAPTLGDYNELDDTEKAKHREWAQRALDIINNQEEGKDVGESLAELDHEQWLSWAGAVLEEVPPERQQRWKKYFVPYEELDDSVKDLDRKWGNKILSTVQGNTQQVEDK